MAHFAEVDSLSKVIRILVIEDDDTKNSNGNEDEPVGVKYLHDAFGGTWVKTSYNTYKGIHKLNGTPFRKNYAGIGCTYDEVRDAFIPPKPYASWTLNEETCQWEAPVAQPEEVGPYLWNEATTTWDET